MISYVTLDEYFGPWIDHKDVTSEVKHAAEVFIAKVNDLLDRAYEDGVDFILNDKTASYISGKTYGGFRPQDCPQGAPQSSHKQGRGVDIYDPSGALDDWCIKHPQDMREVGLYMEHPDATVGWCHLTDRMPASGKIVFRP